MIEKAECTIWRETKSAMKHKDNDKILNNEEFTEEKRNMGKENTESERRELIENSRGKIYCCFRSQWVKFENVLFAG